LTARLDRCESRLVLVRAVIVAATALAAIPAGAAARTAVVHSEVGGFADLSAVGCGVGASASVPLPATATAIAVRRPRVGQTTFESRLTAVTVAGTTVQLTAVGDGPEVCDPEEDPDVPPAERQWRASYPYDVAFRERVKVAYWAGAAVRHARPALRPRKVTVPGVATMVRMRWRSFGGRAAVGHGRLRCEIPGCVGRGDRFKVVLNGPSRCGDVGDRVYYGRIRFYTTRRYDLLYPIRRGALYSGGAPACALTPVTRV
jgi:hypothetical protein